MAKTKRSQSEAKEATEIARRRIEEYLSTGKRTYIIPVFRVEVNGSDYLVDVTGILKELGAVRVGLNYYCGRKEEK